MSKARKPKSPKIEEKPSRVSSDMGSSNKSEMKTSEIRDLIDFISKSGLNEVDIETKELKLHVKRKPDQKVFKSTPIVAPVAAPLTASGPATYAQPSPAGMPRVEKASEENGGKRNVEVKSPMIGTFYRSASPDSPPFVSVGDKITKGQTVCIIEAMKLFNEIESEVSGTIVKVMVENSTPVEYDQPLFLVEPD
jgi:acetyl-CoA carboxylase biotin carboxyl carrier protein